MIKWIKNNKLQFVTILAVVANITTLISFLISLAVPPHVLSYVGLGSLALWSCSLFLFVVILLRQRGPMLERFDDQMKLTKQSEQHSRKLEEESAIAQQGFQAELAQKDELHTAEVAQKDALRTLELAAQQNEFEKRESQWQKQRGSFQKARATVRKIAEDASETQHVLRRCDSEEEFTDANRRVDRFMQESTDWCRESYEPLWGNEAPCRVLVKYLVDEKNMSLMYRDSHSGCVKKQDQRPRKITNYTSYRKIYYNQSRYFFSDDLVALEASAGYSNPKKNWQDLYKTELVVPIGKLDMYDGCGRDLVGFLAISSLTTHIIDLKRDLEIAQTVASHMYDVLAGLDAVKRAQQQKQERKAGTVEAARRMDSRQGDFGNAPA